MTYTVDRCPACGAVDAVIVDPPRDCDYCERDGGRLEQVPVMVAEVTPEMVERAAHGLASVYGQGKPSALDRKAVRAALSAALQESGPRQEANDG